MAPSGTDHDANALASLLDRLFRILQARSFKAGLHPAQWAALRHFARAPATRRTVTALAEVQGTRVPPASRTVARLESQGLVAVSPDPESRRQKRIDLTEAGRLALADDPAHALRTALAELSEGDRACLAGMLATLTERLADTTPSGVPRGPGRRAIMRSESA